MALGCPFDGNCKAAAAALASAAAVSSWTVPCLLQWWTCVSIYTETQSVHLEAILGRYLHPFGPPRGHLGSLWAILGLSWDPCAPFWAILEPILGHLGQCWPFLDPFGPSCGLVGTILSHLETFLGSIRAVLAPPWAIFRKSWTILGPKTTL